MAATTRFASGAVLLLALAAVDAMPARAELFTLTTTGKISANFSDQTTILKDMPWLFRLTYDTAAPDLDAGNPEHGVFANTATPPALRSFHYQAGSYEVTIDNPADFGMFS